MVGGIIDYVLTHNSLCYGFTRHKINIIDHD